MTEKIKLADLVAELSLDPANFIKNSERVKSAIGDVSGNVKSKLGGSLSGIGDKFKSTGATVLTGAAKMATGLGVVGLAAGGLASVGGVALGMITKQAFSLAESAAPLQGAGAAFRALTKDMEGGSQAMLSSLRSASAGLITNTNLMLQFNKASQLISVDFAKQLPGAMESLRKVAAATGEDMTFLLDSLTVGVGRLSPMILDNLSIQVDLTQAYQDFADKNGLVASELSKTQQQAALMAQVTQKLAENTAQLPDVYGSASQAFGAFRTDLINIKEAVGLDLLPTFSELINAGRSLMPAFQSIGQGLAGTFAGIVDVGKQFTRGLLRAFGVDFNTIAKNSGKWGQNIVIQFAKGMASALGAVIQVLNELGKIVTYWLQPHSPPKLLPNLDKWGAGAADAYFEGWTQGNVSILRDLSKQAESFIRSSMAGSDSGDISKAVLASRKAIESAIKSGGNILATLPKQMQAYGSALIGVGVAEKAVAQAQEKLNQVTAKYNQLLAPVNDELSEIAQRRQQIIDDQRKAELESIISDENAPALAKELAQMELREIELQNQKKAIEEQKDTAVNSAKEQVDSATELLDKQKEKLQIEQELLAQQQEALDLQNSQVEATDALTSATGGLGEALGDVGSSLSGLLPLGSAFGGSISEIAKMVRKEFSGVEESAFQLGLTWGEVLQNMRKWWNDNIGKTIADSPILTWLSERIPLALDIMGIAWSNGMKLSRQGAEIYWLFLQRFFEGLQILFTKILPRVIEQAKKNWRAGWEGMKKTVSDNWALISGDFEQMKRDLGQNIKAKIKGLMGDWLDGFSAISKKTTEVKGVVESFWESVKGLWQWLKDHVFSFNVQTPNFPALPFGGGDETTDRSGQKGQGMTTAPNFPASGLAIGGGGSGMTVNITGNQINDPMDLETVTNAVVNSVKRQMRTG